MSEHVHYIALNSTALYCVHTLGVPHSRNVKVFICDKKLVYWTAGYCTGLYIYICITLYKEYQKVSSDAKQGLYQNLCGSHRAHHALHTTQMCIR